MVKRKHLKPKKQSRSLRNKKYKKREKRKRIKCKQKKLYWNRPKEFKFRTRMLDEFHPVKID